MFESLPRRRSRLDLGRYGAFYIVAVSFLAMAVQAVGFLLEWGVTARFSTAVGDHRVHQIVDGVLIGGMILGVLVQLYRPRRRVVAMQSTIVLMVVFSAFAFLGGGPAEGVLPFLVFAAVHGLASVLFSTASSAGPRWGGLELLWGVAFVAVAVSAYRGLLGGAAIEPVEPAGAD